MNLFNIALCPKKKINNSMSPITRFYKGEEAHTLVSWNINDIDINAPQFMHVQHVVRATCGDKVGIGALEQHIVGPHTRYGMKGFLDPL